MTLSKIVELKARFSEVEAGCDYESEEMQEFVLCVDKLMPHLLEAVEIVRSNHVGNARAEALIANLR